MFCLHPWKQLTFGVSTHEQNLQQKRSAQNYSLIVALQIGSLSALLVQALFQWIYNLNGMPMLSKSS